MIFLRKIILLTLINGFAISINFRICGDSFWQNLKETVNSSIAIGFLVRHIINQNISYSKAVQLLQNFKLIAPTYIIVSGYNKNEGCIITRNRIKHEKFTQLNHNNINYNNLWHIISKSPIFNEITIYGTLMCCHDNHFETRLPNKDYGFNPIPLTLKNTKYQERKTCKLCGNTYHESLNAKGKCIHTGEWHGTYDDCKKAGIMTCGYKLGITNLGKQHWSCCHDINYYSLCSKSDKHTPITNSLEISNFSW